MTTAVRPQRPGTPMRPAMAGRPRPRLRAVAASTAAPLVMLVPVALMVAVLAFRIHEAVPSVSKFLRPAVLFGTGGFIFLLVRATPDQRARITADPLVKITALYLLWGIASIPQALYIGAGIETIKVIYTVIFITAAFAMLPATERVLDWLIRAIAITGAIVGVIAIIQNQGSWIGRLSFGGSLDANDLAAVMAMSTALALGAARKGKGLSKLIFLGCAGITTLVIFKTGSRGGFLSLLLTAGVFVLAVPGAKRAIWLSVAALGLVAFWFTAPQATRDRFTTLTDLSNDYNSYAYFGREEIWKRGVGYALKNPILGVGLGNFETAEGESIARDGWHGKWSTAHNAYIQAAAELGLPGLAMFLLMIWRATVAGFRWTTFDKRSGVPPDHARPELLAGVLGMAGAIYFLSFAYSWIVFSILALAQLADRTRIAQRRARASVPARA
ncbi:MAG: O-antigen ligase family protein [Gemmatimonadetes bacterium]|nr:O-antigen ligase family protein [Gemmatimonadota bacterium]